MDNVSKNRDIADCHSPATKGISRAHIPGLVQNVLRITGDGLFTSNVVNQQLLQMGESQRLLGQTGFEPMVSILETKRAYQVKHYNIS